MQDNVKQYYDSKNTSKLSHRVKLLAFIKARLDDICSQKKEKTLD